MEKRCKDPNGVHVRVAPEDLTPAERRYVEKTHRSTLSEKLIRERTRNDRERKESR